VLGDKGMEPHLGLICGNVMPPVGSRPALLTHGDVEMLFHEFGHLMHHCLSRVSVRSLGGTNVAWDFVELPSQIMENWCWEREALDMFARHWETGEKIPDALFDALQRARTFRAANAMMRQLGFAEVDLALHVDFDPDRDGSPVEYARTLLQSYAAAPLFPGYAMVTSFSHLFSNPVGYAAGYYSYKWAEVLDADGFTRFRDEGIFSPAVGKAFRDEILAQGDSRDPMELFQAFMGRPPRVEPLLERSGLL
jgi:oligopeptidase A